MSTQKLMDDSQLQTKASFAGAVEVNFKSDYLPLEKMANPENIAAIQMNAQPGMVKTLAQRPPAAAAATPPPAAAASAAAAGGHSAPRGLRPGPAPASGRYHARHGVQRFHRGRGPSRRSALARRRDVGAVRPAGAPLLERSPGFRELPVAQQRDLARRWCVWRRT